jgi:hypothetical protein
MAILVVAQNQILSKIHLELVSFTLGLFFVYFWHIHKPLIMSNLSSNSAFRQTTMVQSFQQSYDAFQRLQIRIELQLAQLHELNYGPHERRPWTWIHLRLQIVEHGQG